ncbi:hypothetical protein PDE_06604 [Penicillium oxalicum 114-2]|uniref:Reverse transcriptase Ty1/copia-type domain-containing protein n=1 Tax=Penicillium oxalicum (strain 114-2 / CGMCC 5302) TaxID=933388 RepID=S8AYZ0_PENO1|nr:hypothetical protein PDE_06604 [Penicillium oxalicum 114-2]
MCLEGFSPITLYGLKQSPREWYNTVYGALIALGFIRFQADHSAFAHLRKKNYVLLHVDDMLTLSPEDPQWLKDEIQKSFDITDNAPATRFLGIGIVHGDNGCIFLSQQAYIRKILAKFTLYEAHPIQIPFYDKEILQPREDTASPEEILLFRKMIGSLIWLLVDRPTVNNRPEIAFPVTKLARYAHNPSSKHLTAVKRVFRYLKGADSTCISYSHSPEALYGFVDADWADKHTDSCMSTSGFLFKLANGPISWVSKKQTCVALSSTESEYVSASLAVQEVVWLHLFMNEMDPALGSLLHLPTAIYEDNQRAICLTESHEFHRRTKHIDIKYHRLRDQVSRGVCKFVKIATAEQAADGLTKPLQSVQFERFLTLLGMKKLSK